MLYLIDDAGRRRCSLAGLRRRVGHYVAIALAKFISATMAAASITNTAEIGANLYCITFYIFSA